MTVHLFLHYVQSPVVGFDRGGWSPTLFADLDSAGFDTLTWRKGATVDVAEHDFAEHTHVDEQSTTKQLPFVPSHSDPASRARRSKVWPAEVHCQGPAPISMTSPSA